MKCPECLHDTLMLASDLVARESRYKCVKCKWTHRLSIKDGTCKTASEYRVAVNILKADVDRELQQATATLFGE